MDPETLRQLIPLLIPLLLIQIGLLVIAGYDLIKRERVKGGNKLFWPSLHNTTQLLTNCASRAIVRQAK